jgi:hypothetical protein
LLLCRRKPATLEQKAQAEITPTARHPLEAIDE